MPLFEFYCPECSMQFEELIPREAVGAVACIHCGHTPVERKLSVFATSITSPTDVAPCGTTPQNCGANPDHCACAWRD